ncbi:hypothetical protein TNCV_794501, partial [Trichonephila clavipes]
TACTWQQVERDTGDREKDLATRGERKSRNEEEKRKAVARKTWSGKRRYGWTMYCNLVAS